MKKELTTILPYDKVNFKFITSHYDFHLHGSCIYNNSICEFKCEYPTTYNEETEELYEPLVRIYKLTWKEKLKWILEQWIFEKCVGYHFSYKHGKRGKRFYYRTPIWFYMWLFKIYYRVLRYYMKKNKL